METPLKQLLFVCAPCKTAISLFQKYFLIVVELFCINCSALLLRSDFSSAKRLMFFYIFLTENKETPGKKGSIKDEAHVQS